MKRLVEYAELDGVPAAEVVLHDVELPRAAAAGSLGGGHDADLGPSIG